MEKIIALPEEAEEARTRLPIVPIAFGSGSKCPSADEAHLLLSVRAGSLSYTDLSGEETADEGQLLFVRRGHTLPDLAPSADIVCHRAGGGDGVDACDFGKRIAYVRRGSVAIHGKFRSCHLEYTSEKNILYLKYQYLCIL